MYFLRNNLFIALVFFLFSSELSAQELNVRLRIVSQQVQNSNKTTIANLETALREFISNRDWVPETYNPNEKIDCSFMFNITGWDGANNFTADVQILSSRPVFGTSYNSTMLDLNDKSFSFTFVEGQPLQYTHNAYNSNLASFIAYYAYLIIGLDADSFSPLGGTPCFQKALEVCGYANAGEVSKGWSSADFGQTRYWIAENLNNDNYAPLRSFSYRMHRKGLDMMSENLKKSRTYIMESLSDLLQVDKKSPNSVLNNVFFGAKYEEIINVFGGANNQERKKVSSLLSQLDPARADKYKTLTEAIDFDFR